MRTWDPRLLTKNPAEEIQGNLRRLEQKVDKKAAEMDARLEIRDSKLIKFDKLR